MAKMTEEEYRARMLATALGGKLLGKPIPPRKWWEEHAKRVREEHPDYTEEQVNAAVGRIWFKIYDDRRREAAIVAEALHAS
jgi:hypothetical protein